MKTIAVLSGKGGAGKTFVTVNLACTASKAVYVDCDVEEPNGFLFLKPTTQKSISVYKTLPAVDADKCNGCRKCVDFCQFHAFAFLKNKPLLFPEICHSCGGCSMVCPVQAIDEVQKEIGVCLIDENGTVPSVTGKMHLGEESGVKIIEKAIQLGQTLAKKSDALLCIDCPPGSACSVMESIRLADFCLLVVEPTAFGFHNFQMVFQLVKLLHKPFGVVINKEEQPFLPLIEFCKSESIPILAQIPYAHTTASHVADGKIAVQEAEEVKHIFSKLLSAIEEHSQ